ncbi:hypothetical protein EWM64_g2251 [Hericium alpestre]|uniref:FAD dependent oxidoreductase domain-containing protein n=1 Tax=Hericium alpestre TaxID=135208 RepID=A0A4Z0A406_9AGAM|nr:hypothetical protein EWM64_g2251 [Hericium alpestre]
MSPPANIVIVGAGIIGCTTAYYLAHHPLFSSAVKITVLEASRVGPAQGASGKSGGLIAKWAYPKELAKLSYAEHLRLAKELDGAKNWGFRQIEVGEWEGRGRRPGDLRLDESDLRLDESESSDDEECPRRSKASGFPADLTWINEALTDSYTPMAPSGDTAQVHPYLFTTHMLKLAAEKGVEFVKGRVTVLDNDSGHVTGVRYIPVDGTEEVHIPADCIILAAGPWSPSLVPALPITSMRAHSIVIKSPSSLHPNAVTPYALFMSLSLPKTPRHGAQMVTPEIYPRPNQTIYVYGPGDTRTPLPPIVDDVEVDKASCEQLWEWMSESGVFERWALGEVVREQACYLPSVSTGGGPIVGEVPGIKGLVVATGHTSWVRLFNSPVALLFTRFPHLDIAIHQGISNAPGTAKAVSELVLEGKTSCVKLDRPHPAEFV